VVEDEEGVREFTNKVLTGNGYSVLTAATAKEGLATFEREKDNIDLVFSDDGVGFPNDFDIENVTTLGLRLVSSLVKNQMKGNLNFVRNNGTKIIMNFDTTKHIDGSENYE